VIDISQFTKLKKRKRRKRSKSLRNRRKIRKKSNQKRFIDSVLEKLEEPASKIS